MDIELNIFKRVVPDYKKLINYGFMKDNNEYKYNILLMDNLEARIQVKDGLILGKIIDLDFNEEYINFRIEGQLGNYVGKVREEYMKLLEDIREKCFIKKLFISDQANRINDLIFKKYKCSPIFKWKSNNYAVYENNSKWFGIIMNIDRSKFSDLSGETEILNIKLAAKKVSYLLKKKGFYKAYHMNKKSWITIVLDDTIKDIEIMQLIAESYAFTVGFKGKDNEWVMPINPSYFDVFAYFDNSNIFYFDIKKSFKKGDILYLYITKPIGSIMYKCYIEDFTEDFMVVRKICKYDKNKYNFELLKKYGLASVRSTRHIPVNLSNFLNKNN